MADEQGELITRYEARLRKQLEVQPSPIERGYTLLSLHRDLLGATGHARCLACDAELGLGEIEEWTDLGHTAI